MSPLSFFILSLILFVLGMMAFLIKRDLITQFMAIEIMLNAANLALVAAAKYWASLDGQIIVFFVITVAAAEAAVGLAIILLIYRQKKTIRSEEVNLLKG
ncbi:MAG: NADH-quinone oxidoreductase subunit NuoK [Candidatus Aminicenantes bacterium]|nr:NADH-quinone oxidoreductase subunit NuoK [Candidatus Aminicenantes bacterium]